VLPGPVIVLDVGKTLAKLSLWASDGSLIERRTRPNARPDAGEYVALDADGIEQWIWSVLADFSRMQPIHAIVPVAHGAAAAIVREGRLVCPPMDYEEAVPAAERQHYNISRDPFLITCSPALPEGLNLGAQIHRLAALHPRLLDGDATIMPWPQYWAWRLCGVAASEVSSLGCHTDLWQPLAGTFSPMAEARGWARRFAPLCRADHVLGTITAEAAQRTGLPSAVKVYCGLHDSNAALVAARGFSEIAKHESTVLSTGTWFIAMRSPGPEASVDLSGLPEKRDCLVNVDVAGCAVPSSRSMGGREIETLTGIDTRRIDIAPDQATLLSAVPAILGSGAMVLPTMAPDCGPFPHGRGRWIAMPTDQAQRRAAVSLYAALVANTSLDLIGSKDRLLIEGRFAEAEVFVRALARLRPQTRVYVSHAHNDVSYGALRLVAPDLPPRSALVPVPALDTELQTYRDQWHRLARRAEEGV
jgi:sugar (pentulose or hexulose) kinase